MKQKIIIFILIVLMISAAWAATRNFVPRADGEGSLGTAPKNWGAAHIETGAFDSLAVSGTITTDTINEYTVAAGVTIDGALLKDSTINGVTIDSPSANIIQFIVGATSLGVLADCTINQNLSSAASPTFAGLTVSGFIQRSVTAGITATNPGVQGDTPLTTEINEVSTVGAGDDAVTLPAAVAGRVVVIINNGANQLEIWPASGDDAGGGVDTAVTLASGSNVQYVAYDVTNWESI